MNPVLRVIFAPAILSTYITYGIISANKTADMDHLAKRRARDYLAGGMLGLAFGGYYIITGQRLDETSNG